ncbi:MAG TPA: hypothetical protein VFY65_14080, partial [Longimicrobium sp.]|nr:hypothetical protein [Longimicrobium sp.]
MRRWRSAAAALALLAPAACAPRGTRVPTVPVVVIGDTARPAPRDTVVIAPTPPPPAQPVDVAPVANATAVRVGLIVDTSTVEITSAGDFTVHTEDGREIGRLRGGETVSFRDVGQTVTMSGGQAGG